MSASPETFIAVEQMVGQVQELKRHLRCCSPRDPTRAGILRQMREIGEMLAGLQRLIEQVDPGGEYAQLASLMASACADLEEATIH